MKRLLTYLKLIRKLPGNVQRLLALLDERPEYDLKNPKVLAGKLLAAQHAKLENITDLRDVEFQVFSQWGEDGIIQYLIGRTDIPHKTFVEFGVENYKESNTRFLLVNNNWRGLVMDGSKANTDFIRSDLVSWAHELHAWPVFITRDNINEHLSALLAKGFDKELGLLSIDVDGNDYWIWEAVNVVSPIIVVMEYNSLYGPDATWAIPYQEDFWRLQKGNTILHYGASLSALVSLGEKKGYDFIGCNSAGNNAFFIRSDKNRHFRKLTAREGYVRSHFRELRGADGEWVSGDERRKALKGFRVVNTETGQIETIS